MNPADLPLSGPQVETLLQLLGRTRDRELNCAECLEHVGEFAEHQLAGQDLDAAIACVENHLALCPECREEYEALLRILRAAPPTT